MALTQQDLVEIIKKKKELSGIIDKVVEDSLEKHLRKFRVKIEDLGKSELKLVVKSVRAELRGLVGQFRSSIKDRNKMLDENRLDELLKTHSSTKERIDFYPEIRKLIAELKIKSILDLGCGINPIALAEKGVRYDCSDINGDDLSIVRKFFEKNNIDGKVFVYDLKKFANDLPEADLCILFKVLDTIEKENHYIARELIENLKCKFIFISFSSRKLSGENMNHPEREWLERILTKLNYNYKKIRSNNEIFYLVKK